MLPSYSSTESSVAIQLAIPIKYIVSNVIFCKLFINKPKETKNVMCCGHHKTFFYINSKRMQTKLNDNIFVLELQLSWKS